MIWEFTRAFKHNKVTMITVTLDENCLGAYADDSYYYGDLPREKALELARAILEKFDPEAYARLMEHQ